MMERRYEQRLPLRIDVRVSDRRGNVVYCRTRDIAVNGAFLETEGAGLLPSEVVRVGLPNPQGAGDWADVAAVVVHHCANGVGVMFSHPIIGLTGSAKARRAARLSQEAVAGDQRLAS